MDADARNVSGVFQPGFFPGFAGVFRFPHTVAIRHIATHGIFTATDVNDIIVVFAHRNCPNGAAKIAVADVGPSFAAVGCAPDAPACTAKIKEFFFAGNAGNRR